MCFVCRATKHTLALLLEGELALLVVVLVLSSSAVLTTLVGTAESAHVFSVSVCGGAYLSLVLGHGECVAEVFGLSLSAASLPWSRRAGKLSVWCEWLWKRRRGGRCDAWVGASCVGVGDSVCQISWPAPN